jgi:hypothetical protein
MRSDDLREFMRHQPFEPFRFFTTEGKAYEIRHPDQMIVLRSRVVLAVGADESDPDRTEHIALLHIVRVEALAGAGKQPRSNGNGEG